MRARSKFVNRLVDPTRISLIDWMIDWLIDWLIGWLIDWLMEPVGALCKACKLHKKFFSFYEHFSPSVLSPMTQNCFKTNIWINFQILLFFCKLWNGNLFFVCIFSIFVSNAFRSFCVVVFLQRNWAISRSTQWSTPHRLLPCTVWTCQRRSFERCAATTPPMAKCPIPIPTVVRPNARRQTTWKWRMFDVVRWKRPRLMWMEMAEIVSVACLLIAAAPPKVCPMDGTDRCERRLKFLKFLFAWLHLRLAFIPKGIVSCQAKSPVKRLKMIDWLIDWLIDLFIYSSIFWLIDWFELVFFCLSFVSQNFALSMPAPLPVPPLLELPLIEIPKCPPNTCYYCHIRPYQPPPVVTEVVKPKKSRRKKPPPEVRLRILHPRNEQKKLDIKSWDPWKFMNSLGSARSFVRLIDWLIDWLIDFFRFFSLDWLIDWLFSALFSRLLPNWHERNSLPALDARKSVSNNLRVILLVLFFSRFYWCDFFPRIFLFSSTPHLFFPLLFFILFHLFPVHPSCTKLPKATLFSMKQYAWQCSDCKVCLKCNSATHEVLCPWFFLPRFLWIIKTNVSFLLPFVVVAWFSRRN